MIVLEIPSALTALPLFSSGIKGSQDEGKKGNQNVNTGWSFLQGNSAMAYTEKRESSPFFLYVRISLKLSLFVWRIKYSIKNPFRGKGG